MKKENLYTRRQVIRKTIISFAEFAALMGGGIATWLYIKNLPLDHGSKGGVQPPVRKVLTANENIFDKTLSNGHLAKSYPKSAAVKRPRVNGNVGIDRNYDASSWQFNIAKQDGSTLTLSLDDIQQLPKTEIVFDFKCIEGWSMITYWGGVKFSDFISAYNLQKETAMKYVGFATPDKRYYVGIDTPSAMHPQTLICYELNGAALPPEHGAPLRLIIPVKYGVKNLKRIGSMYFANERPPDYWDERGYDYYLGL
jgi:Oxidoreductase molybdopterin binding domain